MAKRYFKVLSEGKSFTCTRVPYSLPKKDGTPGDWMPSRHPRLCSSGWHVATEAQVPRWVPNSRPFEIYEVETRGVGVHSYDKSVFSSIRLMRLVFRMTAEEMRVNWIRKQFPKVRRTDLSQLLKKFEENDRLKKSRAKAPDPKDFFAALDEGDLKKIEVQTRKIARYLSTRVPNLYYSSYSYQSAGRNVYLNLRDFNAKARLSCGLSDDEIRNAIREVITPGWQKQKAMDGLRKQLKALQASPKLNNNDRKLITQLRKLLEEPAPTATKKKTVA